MTTVLFVLFAVPVYLLMLWPLMVGARRVLGLRIGLVRALLAASAGWGVAVNIMTLLFPTALRAHGLFVGLIIPIAGCAFLGTLAFLFVAEMAVPSGHGANPLGIVRSVRLRLARVRRYSQVSRIAVRHGIGPYLHGRHNTRVGADATDARRQAALARSLRRALEDGGVTFVKLGQVLSTRPDILPPVFIDELSRLQNQVRSVDQETVQAELADALGRPVAEVFAELDEDPMATASIAQVYRARLHSGEDVVVKVRKPGIDKVVERDLDILRRMAVSLDVRARWARSIGVVSLAEGFAAALTEELDFRVEARNILAVAATHASGSTDGSVAIPTVFEEFSGERVLVMRRLEGTPIRSATPHVTPDRRVALAGTLLNCILRQLLLHGVFHADPHPGNVLVMADGSLGLLDFGSVGRIDVRLRDGLRDMLAAIDRGDPSALRDGLLEIVDRPERIDEHRLERVLGR